MFTIVKYAGDTWDYHWQGDPKKGVDISCSAHKTYTGRQVGIEESYHNKVEAEIACTKMNEYNPSGDYAVCPVIVKELTND